MQINPNLTVSSNPVVTSGRKHRETETGPAESFQRTHEARGPRDPREAGRSKGKNNEYRKDNRQFRDGTNAGSINGASSGGHLSGLAAAQASYSGGRRWDVKAMAKNIVEGKGLQTSFPPAVLKEVAAIPGPETVPAEKLISFDQLNSMSKEELAQAMKDGMVVDLRPLPSSSVDNGDGDKIVTSKDLDQAGTSIRQPDGSVRMLIQIPDVDGLVPQGSATDRHALGDIDQIVAWHKKAQAEEAKSEGNGRGGGGASKIPTVPGNSFSIYTPGQVYPMLPERLSTDLTSINEGVDRTCLVADYTVNPDGSLGEQRVYRAIASNEASMAYTGIGRWLDPDADGVITSERGPVPGYLADAPPEADIPGQITMQAEITQAMKKHREENGALRFADMQVEAKMGQDGKIEDIDTHHATVATQLIEDEMVAANGVVSRALREAGFPTLQRVVKDPEKWDKIVEFAAEKGGELPNNPDAKALKEFLNSCKDRDDFVEISSQVVRLMGKGEYMAVAPGESPEGHFAMAVDDYSHFTAPNRRGPDIITHRMLKAAMAGEECPYTMEQLEALAAHFTAQEGNIKKAERAIEKMINAVWLDQNGMVGQEFTGRISGANPKGTWVRAEIPDPDPSKKAKKIEGFLKNAGSVKMGDEVKIELTNVDPEKGRIDFTRI